MMPTIRMSAITLALACSLSAAALAEERSARPATATAISPIFGQLVSFSVPLNFVAAHENTKDRFYIREAVPRGETVNQWSQMITVTGAKGAATAPDFTPQIMAGLLAAGFRKACPETFAVKTVEVRTSGAQGATANLVGCGRVNGAADGHSEIALIIVIRGAQDAYTIQWAERSGATTAPALDAVKWQERLQMLMPIRLCPIKPGEPAPYPSCSAS